MSTDTSGTTATELRQPWPRRPSSWAGSAPSGSASTSTPGVFQVHAVWRDADKLNGGAHYEDSVLLAYTTELGKIQSWLAR